MTAAPALPSLRGAERIHHIVGVAWLAIRLGSVNPLLFYILPINPYYLTVGLFATYFALLRPAQIVVALTKPFFWLWLITAVVPVFLYLFSERNFDAYSSMRAYVTNFSAFAGSMVVLAGARPREMLRHAALVVLVVAIPFNFVELVTPILTVAPGRAAGLFQNPNMSAGGISVCLLLATDFRRHTARELAIMAAGMLAIVITFSRSGMVGGALIWMAYLILPRGRQSLRMENRFLILIGLFTLFLIGAAVAMQFVDLSVGEYQIRSLVEGRTDDPSFQGRVWGLRNAWHEFSKTPWTGVGLGTPEYYFMGIHNAYLQIAVEFGIGGLLVYLLILFVPLFQGIRVGWQRGWRQIALALYIIYFGIFDHSANTQPAFVAIFAAFAAGVLIEPPAPRTTSARSPETPPDLPDWSGSGAPLEPFPRR